MTELIDLASLLSIWPIAESFALYTPVGDLITLSRTTSSLRSSLRGRLPESTGPRRFSTTKRTSSLDPKIGRHQTNHWIHLKLLAPFTCWSTTHVRGQNVKPCVYCSKPICDACIVRDSFKHRNENTFKNRLRYYCTDCWGEGRPTRSFRYPAVEVGNGDSILDSTLDNETQTEAVGFCECNLKDNGWLCLSCKDEQNKSDSAPSRLILNANPGTQSTQCYGLECTNTIDLGSPEKDRRRVCLWCQKPLRRQYSGEDRYAWNLKTIEARARNAESRSRDLEEYHRRRLRVMRMSRAEMRGTSEPGDEQPIFVRHLDTVNYRNWMAQSCVPNPEAVWQSKNGYWRYQRDFIFALHASCRHVKFTAINGVNVEDISNTTRENSLQHSRLNRELYHGYLPISVPTTELSHTERNKHSLNELKAHILDLHLTDNQDSMTISWTLDRQYELDISAYEIEPTLRQWLDRPTATATATPGSSVEEISSLANGKVTTAMVPRARRFEPGILRELHEQGRANTVALAPLEEACDERVGSGDNEDEEDDGDGDGDGDEEGDGGGRRRRERDMAADMRLSDVSLALASTSISMSTVTTENLDLNMHRNQEDDLNADPPEPGDEPPPYAP